MKRVPDPWAILGRRIAMNGRVAETRRATARLAIDLMRSGSLSPWPDDARPSSQRTARENAAMLREGVRAREAEIAEADAMLDAVALAAGIPREALDSLLQEALELRRQRRPGRSTL